MIIFDDGLQIKIFHMTYNLYVSTRKMDWKWKSYTIWSTRKDFSLKSMMLCFLKHHDEQYTILDTIKNINSDLKIFLQDTQLKIYTNLTYHKIT